MAGLLSPQDQLILNYHRSSLESGNWRRNADGSGTTILIGEVEGPDGKIYMVPYYDQDTGQTMTRDEANRKWMPLIEAGMLPVDSTPQEHNDRANRLHDELEKDKISRAPRYDALAGIESPYYKYLRDYLDAGLLGGRPK